MEDVAGVSSAIVHHVFLIRHGETVDNVAGLYAGVRDSDLTVHGVQQANKLGQYFFDHGINLTHIFSSNLSRAVKTANALRDAQQYNAQLKTVQCEELREQDFGSLEGKPFSEKPRPGLFASKKASQASSKTSEAQVDVESKEAMAQRADRFLSTHISLILSSKEKSSTAIVSHGMLLASLWRCMLRRQPKNSVRISPELISDGTPFTLERLGSWSNTGYLELEVTLSEEIGLAPGDDTTTSGSSPVLTSPRDVNAEKHGQRETSINTEILFGQPYPACTIMIRKINSKAHLQGLKRARGGVGSSRYDEKQKSLNDFFKKQRVE